MSALHEAARRVVAAWVSTQPAWIEECNYAVLALDAALKAEPAQEPVATQHSEALRLADSLRDGVPYDEAEIENELRRLSAENERLHQINQSHEMKLSVRGYEIQIADLEAQRDALLERADTLQRWYDQQLDSLAAIEAQRDALLEAVKGIVDFIDGPAEAKRPDVFLLRISKARAAIKAVEEGK